ncbi:PolC-type DNA polymerase III [Thioalkalivibrio sulfidiphilus]|uniref:Exonuclease n=1 Tax=Thioalkalivibrio sulfidiphilus (strain HL-EbGR7) TaxID=396588 RepID=B8GP22_THISH|nr:3'-5' exonuclease [Thioalkalivibrio sulfidiphilus]ACL72111.1 exonuclease [Thioalkalivibrio sulfidiphilus HL-EbGr7]
MSFLSTLFGNHPNLDPGIEDRLARWRALPEPSARTSLDEARFVVIDVETTGLDLSRSELLSVGLVPVGPHGIELGGLDEIVLRREVTRIDKDNLVVHGISPTESAAGVDIHEALSSVLERIGKTWLVAFHADFDRIILGRTLRKQLGVKLRNPFLDLAMLLPALYSEGTAGLKGLDDWLGHFAIPCPVRHRASADALVTAELLLLALAEARRQNHNDLRALDGLAQTQAKLHLMRH